MIQPSGSVLGRPSRYSIYLRSSPIFCLLNFIDFFLRVLTWTYYNFRGQLAPLVGYIEELAPEAQNYEDHIHGRKAEKSTIFSVVAVNNKFELHRLAVVLAALIPFTKLMSLHGIFWTQFCGSCFFVSILQTYCTSSLVMLARYQGANPSSPPATKTTKTAPPAGDFVVLDQALFNCASIWFHPFFLFSLIAQVWPSYERNWLWEKDGTYDRDNLTAYPTFLVFISLALDLTIPAAVLIPFSMLCSLLFYDRHTQPLRETIGWGAANVYILYQGWKLAVHFVNKVSFFKGYLWDMCFFGPPIGAHFALLYGGHRLSYLTRLLRLTVQDQQGDLRMDTEACCYFILTLYALVLTTLYYIFKYDQTGTINPSGTTFF